MDCKDLDRTGFWFPRFRYVICFLHKFLSLRQRQWVNRILTKYVKYEPSRSGNYQIFWLFVGVIWIFLIELPILTEWYWVYPGICIALYRPMDIFLFTLDWLFVKEKPVENFRRSLAMFLLNMLEIGLYFSIVYILNNSSKSIVSVWSVVVRSVEAVFGLKYMADLNETYLNSMFSTIQIVISWFLYVVILANVVGSISRGEKKDDKKHDCP